MNFVKKSRKIELVRLGAFYMKEKRLQSAAAAPVILISVLSVFVICLHLTPKNHFLIFRFYFKTGGSRYKIMNIFILIRKFQIFDQ